MPGPGSLPGRGRHRAHASGPEEPRKKSWARLTLLSMGIGVGVLLLVLPFFGGDDAEQDVDIPVAAGTSATSGEGQPGVLESMLTSSPSESAGTPTPGSSPSESVTPTPTASPSESPTPSPSRTPSPKPKLLGPGSSGELANMVQRYCDRHTGGSADARSDGRWQCRRFLSSDPIVDMDVACRDTYGSGAYGQNSGGGAYGWRCYRKS